MNVADAADHLLLGDKSNRIRLLKTKILRAEVVHESHHPTRVENVGPVAIKEDLQTPVIGCSVDLVNLESIALLLKELRDDKVHHLLILEVLRKANTGETVRILTVPRLARLVVNNLDNSKGVLERRDLAAINCRQLLLQLSGQLIDEVPCSNDGIHTIKVLLQINLTRSLVLVVQILQVEEVAHPLILLVQLQEPRKPHIIGDLINHVLNPLHEALDLPEIPHLRNLLVNLDLQLLLVQLQIAELLLHLSLDLLLLID